MYVPFFSFAKEHGGTSFSFRALEAENIFERQSRFRFYDDFQAWADYTTTLSFSRRVGIKPQNSIEDYNRFYAVKFYTPSYFLSDIRIIADDTDFIVRELNCRYPSSLYHDDLDPESTTVDSDGVVYSTDGRYLLFAPICADEYHIHEGTKFIANDAFIESQGLKRVYLPQGLEVIGSGAFYGCSELYQVEFPNSLMIIRERAFHGCGLVTLNLPSNLAIIEDLAFSCCDNLSFAYIPETVVSIGKAIFENSGLNHLLVSPYNAYFDSREDCNGIINSLIGELVAGCENTIVPKSVSHVNEYAFSSYHKVRTHSSSTRHSYKDDEESIMRALSEGRGDSFGFD